ncbi:MAG TPA: response regulator transcription factor, partial [Dehalococcoidia bacterium]|nr:response regulator transcription factor [Dehalococcoidia bacterium]
MGSQKTVCLSEEDPAIQRLIVMILEQYGIQATICSSGEELLGAIRATKPDLAVVDVGIPAEPAINVIGQIRAQSIPVLATDATGENSIARTCVQAGADDHQPKPFDPDTLLDRIAFLLGRPPLARQETAVFGSGSIRLDLLNRTLTVQGNRVPLSRTE